MSNAEHLADFIFTEIKRRIDQSSKTAYLRHCAEYAAGRFLEELATQTRQVNNALGCDEPMRFQLSASGHKLSFEKHWMRFRRPDLRQFEILYSNGTVTYWRLDTTEDNSEIYWARTDADGRHINGSLLSTRELVFQSIKQLVSIGLD